MKERWSEMLEYQQKVQAMTDLERAYAVLRFRHGAATMYEIPVDVVEAEASL